MLYQIHRTEEDYALAEFWKWALAFLIGVAMGCIGFIVDWGIQTLNDFKYYHTVALIASRGATPQLQEPHACAHTLLFCPRKGCDLQARNGCACACCGTACGMRVQCEVCMTCLSPMLSLSCRPFDIIWV